MSTKSAGNGQHPSLWALGALVALGGACAESRVASGSGAPGPTADSGSPAPDAIVDGGPEARGDAVALDAELDATCETHEGTVVSVPTRDGLTLAADLHTTGRVGAPGVVLLHMIPPSNTRANYPPAFREALVDRGVNVLNLDRRGAGGDPGLARTAYVGPDGKWDTKAAVDYLVSHPCATDADRIVIIGASNGTTSAVDYAVYAAATDGVALPRALVFLTGGPYTEAQNRIDDHRSTFGPMPLYFVFSAAERAWSDGLRTPDAPADWRFGEFDPGAHGTRMFGRRPESIAMVADFVAEVVNPT